ncbi:winged helix domain-containing protein [Sphingomonas sp. RB1R13]|uniref:winged helix domain-containing protein n=1 Tax=Sphingomonas sp. RB1R13 TaxID=3096159 RepID=UPI002FCB6FE9
MDNWGSAPKAVTAASGANIAQVETSSTPGIYAKPSRPFKLIIVEAIGPAGRFEVIGQVAKTLVASVEHSAAGLTAIEVNSWASRLGAYVHTLRHDYGLAIETVHEDHEGGWHARYRFVSPVTIEWRLA